MRIDTVKMDELELFYTIAYVLISACLIHPPTEFVSAGLTVQNLFSNFLGSEQMHFIYYHMKRTTATVLFHSFIPLGYFVGYTLVLKKFWMLNLWKLSLFWQYYVMFSVMLPVCAGILTLYWSQKKWDNHPVAKLLQKFAQENSTWRAVASSINVEFRRIDKFTTGLPGRRLIVMDSWIVKTSTYYLYVAHQTDIVLHVVGADEHEIAYDSTTGAQFLNISVNNIHGHIKPFIIRLNAAEYQDLKDKLQAPIRSAREIVIRLSTSDRFIEAFRQQVVSNTKYRKPQDVDIEPCIGCMQKDADCKLQKLCADADDGDCKHCYCRPMWCVECMARWFVNRQDQSTPEQWMASKSPCPTCRSTFCMLDVCMVE